MSIEFLNSSVAHFKHHEHTLALSGTIKNGEIHILQGPSGCGKSTLLRALAQVDSPFVDYKINSISVMNLSASDRRVSLVFQKPLLFPHLNVIDNILFPIQFVEPWKSWSDSLRKSRAEEFLNEISLSHLATSFPKDLSGGESMRVSLVRSLVSEPRFLLLDEPFSGLDKDTKEGLKQWLTNKIKTNNIPTLWVTHVDSDFEGLDVHHHLWPSPPNFSLMF